MSTDNRTLLNGAEADTDSWAGDDAVTDTSAAGDYYQGTQGLSTQLSNALERMTCSTIGGTRDMSDASVWFLAKDNLQSAKSAGGGQVVLSDGTDEIGFYCNGNDSPGLALPSYYNCLKLDVSNRGALSSNAYTGSAGALTVASITGVGYGSLHQSKANGAIDNVWMDASYFIVNTSYALTINAGTVGTPETWSDVSGDDVTNGWGMVSNLQGSKYDINASWEWGDTANADSYFEDSNFQIFIDARDMGTGNFLVRTIAGTGTNSLVLESGLFQNLGTPAVWDLSDADMNIFEWTSITWTDAGALTFPVDGGTSRFANTCIFNNCGQVDFQSLVVTDCTFNGSTNADGAIIWDADDGSEENQTGLIFNSDGTGHAIVITAPGTYNIDGYVFNGYAAQGGTAANRAIYNNSGGAVIINVSGGLTPSYRDGTSATTTVNNNVTVTFSGLALNTEVRVYATTGGAELAGIEDSGTTFGASVAGGTDVYYTIHNVEYEHIRVEDFIWPASATTIPIQQRFDSNYKND
jgi:hypothetical protein